jgi:SAM-dependent methyltransferase
MSQNAKNNLAVVETGWTGEESRIRSFYGGRDARVVSSWSEPAFLFTIQERERRVLALLRDCGYASLANARLLEVGCGKGFWLNEFVKWGMRPENVAGVDLLAERVADARRVCPALARIERANGAGLPFDDRSFDLVLQSMAFSSILSRDLRQQVAGEMARVAKAGGVIVWYDFHVHPRSADVEAIRKKEIHRLFPGCRVRLRRITLAPPLVRLIAPYSRLACDLLGRIPWLCSHYLGAIRKE